MSSVKRIYVEKKIPYAVRAQELLEEIKNYLAIETLKQVRVLIRYDLENISEETVTKALGTVFSEPPVDFLYQEDFPKEEKDYVFSVEYLPGQFDQRADSAVQCVKLLSPGEEPVINCAATYVLTGSLTEEEFGKIKAYCINPVDSREAAERKPETLETSYAEPEDVAILTGFTAMSFEELNGFYQSLNLAMTTKDFLHVQKYFAKEEKRDPSLTEIRVLDTYWSDHCRHTTFLTELTDVKIEEGFFKKPIEDSYNRYREDYKELYKNREDKYMSLMDVALMAMKKLKSQGKLQEMEESEEINACSIIVPVEIEGKTEEWLVFFKNETHNHPTEIEPFGGAATCLGGAIRDPLSGRGYVYQAMRVTGAADPRVAIEDTLKGKLPQRKIVTGAASGYSSYGNQIGLATGLVDEIYHPGYVAKRMEIGAVMGAAPRKNVIRESSEPGDKIILLGGRTGRDGCGGATGSSKVHTASSIETCGAEVQKGNAPTERKLQRLFRREEVSSLIKKCNDFGAGGVSVAIGELADGLFIDLDKVPKKYAGLDGTELAISESQERMAIVADAKDVEALLAFAGEENLEATLVAEVTEEPRLVMVWRGKEIVNISRAFLNTNGAHQETAVVVTPPEKEKDYFKAGISYYIKDKEELILKDKWIKVLGDLNSCSKKGLVEMFDSSIGAATVTMPYGGKYQMTPAQTMAAKLPSLKGECDTVTLMSYGFDPYLSSWSPYHGAVYAIIFSVAKIVASGGDYKSIYFTFQEYFKRLGENEKSWGEPLAALLGAYEAQLRLGLASIGGKDSMSGTFQDIDVPPTLVSFAVAVAKASQIITGELKEAGSFLIEIQAQKDGYGLPDYEAIKVNYEKVHDIMEKGAVISAYAPGAFGVAEAASKMAFGNGFGVSFEEKLSEEELFAPAFGALLLEVKEEQLAKLQKDGLPFRIIGKVTEESVLSYKDTVIDLAEVRKSWEAALEKVYPTSSGVKEETISTGIYETSGEKHIYIGKAEAARPKVFIPVFPGTNCEYDSALAFEKAGAVTETVVFNNLTSKGIDESVKRFVRGIREAQILMFPGGFSAGDEPDGSGKFIATAFRNEQIKEAVNELLKQRDGLALGICNGFQALIKLGLVPYGEITAQSQDSPTLTTNHIGRHVSKYVYTKVVSNRSPWLKKAELGGIYAIPTSHGEGRFVADKEWIDKLFANGQVATQYVDFNGIPTMKEAFNPNGSYYAIEGITSPDGRVLGKMTHSERKGKGVAINITGSRDQYIFESGVEYFR
ncbi:phosphoribosylformylglycinamidine synthase [Anaerocolumna xylanovorans]|uniref:Phosphoribosylformylglycinamidine synthase n=1 Tax=Anaerocolumna xylanovorans DSM 12503 TaxID=1121345 RepID=A0A1M7Y3A6_9FIRM|nr:phosphoribosylformylglycinamidine synthase [Anaerocolumna xylanovorans]SHO46643.1 phosphoribosylformylglycinamidine synthase [Anaerocolumna xylanovorans DSM 12503]